MYDLTVFIGTGGPIGEEEAVKAERAWAGAELRKRERMQAMEGRVMAMDPRWLGFMRTSGGENSRFEEAYQKNDWTGICAVVFGHYRVPRPEIQQLVQCRNCWAHSHIEALCKRGT